MRFLTSDLTKKKIIKNWLKLNFSKRSQTFAAEKNYRGNGPELFLTTSHLKQIKSRSSAAALHLQARGNTPAASRY